MYINFLLGAFGFPLMTCVPQGALSAEFIQRFPGNSLGDEHHSTWFVLSRKLQVWEQPQSLVRPPRQPRLVVCSPKHRLPQLRNRRRQSQL